MLTQEGWKDNIVQSFEPLTNLAHEGGDRRSRSEARLTEAWARALIPQWGTNMD